MEEGLVGWTVESSGHGCPVPIQVRRAGVEDFQRLRLDVRVTYRGKTRVLDTDLTGSVGRDGHRKGGTRSCKMQTEADLAERGLAEALSVNTRTTVTVSWDGVQPTCLTLDIRQP